MKSKGRWGLFVAISLLAILVVYGLPHPSPREASKPLPPEPNIRDSSSPTEEITLNKSPVKMTGITPGIVAQIKQTKPDVVLLFDDNAAKFIGAKLLHSELPGFLGMAVESQPGSGTKFIIHLPLEGRQA